MSMAGREPEADARRWAGSTLDERTAGRRRQLIEVGLELLGTEGAAAVTVRAVTRAAQLSPRYFYESFSSREDLLEAAFDHGFGVIKSAVSEAMTAGGDFATQARAAIDATARCLEEDPRLGRALMREAIADPTLRRRAEGALVDFVLGVAVRSDEALSQADPARLQVGAIGIAGLQLAILMAWSEGQLPVSREALVDQVVAVVVAIASTLS